MFTEAVLAALLQRYDTPPEALSTAVGLLQLMVKAEGIIAAIGGDWLMLMMACPDAVQPLVPVAVTV